DGAVPVGLPAGGGGPAASRGMMGPREARREAADGVPGAAAGRVASRVGESCQKKTNGPAPGGRSLFLRAITIWTGSESTASRRGARGTKPRPAARSEEHTSELQSRENLVCRL